ncbi:MAG: SulP family inorganic anion transporter, partial [Gemmatimonadaceae bacterium]|nr:SulP family inorganic anion transporter [Gemmatimonadaceae bacterium]
MSDAPKAANPTGADPEANQPGLGDLRVIVANHLKRRLPGRSTMREDVAAGMSIAVGNVPDGMANGFLVGVNPIHGLYATIMGPIVGGALSSTQLMVITTTAAASLTASQPLADMPVEARTGALFVMVVLAGLFQLLFAVLGLARLTRFVSYSVTTGFLTGIAVLLILSQLPTIAGYPVLGANRVMQTLDLMVHIQEVNPAALGLAVMTIALARWLPRTPLRGFGRLVAIIIPSLIVALFHIDGVQLVRDLGEIGRSMPTPDMPSMLRLAPGVLTGALSIAAVVT